MTNLVNPYPDVIEVPGILSTHEHPRDTDAEGDGRAELIIPHLARAYEDVIAMGNTARPLTTPELARAKAKQWRALIPEDKPLRIHVAGLMTEATTPEEVLAGYNQQDWAAMKMFLRAVSNSGGADVDDVRKIIPALNAMTYGEGIRRPIPLLIHAERKFDLHGKRIFFLNREKEAMERDVRFMLSEVPGAALRICHVGDRHTLDMIEELRRQGYDICAEISPHYTQYCIDDLFEGPDGGTALNSHLFCMPFFKTPEDRDAIHGAMVSGKDWLYYGPDNACHIDNTAKDKGVKVSSLGYTVGGQTQIPEATLSYVVEKFVEAGALEHLAGFLSNNGRKALLLPPAQNYATFTRNEWVVPKYIGRTSPTLGELRCKVAMGGQTRQYQIAI